jgi:DnaJ domain/PilZ domain
MASSERRRQNRASRKAAQPLKITVSRPQGGMDEIPGRLVDSSEGGIGVETGVPLAVGSTVRVTSPEGIHGRIGAHKAQVRWCEPGRGGSFQSGLQFDDAVETESRKEKEAPPEADANPPDFYDTLQLSPKADLDTIHRVFRVLAQRYHPDNLETGDEETFKQVMAAYEVLSDPQRRASFDAKRIDTNRVRWRIFDQPQAAVGVEAEKRKRQGVLSLLYAKRLGEPHQPFMNLHEFEELLGCPREHLEFTLWYLKETGLISRLDNGKYGITAKGVDQNEQSGGWRPSEAKMLPAAEPAMAR